MCLQELQQPECTYNGYKLLGWFRVWLKILMACNEYEVYKMKKKMKGQANRAKEKESKCSHG